MSDYPTSLVTVHTSVSDNLATTLRELADLRSAIIRNQASAWQQSSHLGITERREEVKHSFANLLADVENLLGEVDALRVELTNIELRIEHGG